MREMRTAQPSGCTRGANAVSRCRCLLMTLLLALTALPDCATAEAASAAAGGNNGGTCGGSLNLGLDYFLRTRLFANLTKVDLPTEIPLPGGFKIVNLRIAGLDSVSRGCSLELGLADESRLRVRACARVARVGASFVLKAIKYAVDFVQAALTDASVSAEATVRLAPGGRIQLESFDVTLGNIEVENTGITGAIITRLMKLDSVRERVRAAIVAQGGKKIQEELNKHPLPE